MRVRLLNLLLVAALALAFSRLWLFLREPPPALTIYSAETKTAAQSSAGREESSEVAETGVPGPEAYDVIVARDLFSPTRGVVAPVPMTAGATKPVVKPPQVPKLTLSGVVILDGVKTAYLQEGTQEARTKIVKENDSFANGIVKAIRPDGITFLFAGTEIDIPLRLPRDGTAAPVPRGQAAAVAPIPSAPATPAASPAAPRRRQLPIPVQKGQMSPPGRPASAPRAAPTVAPPVETGEEILEEEFPDESMPGGEAPDAQDEDGGE